MSEPIQYNILISTDSENYSVDWGNESGWIEKYSAALARATQLTIYPKEGVSLPAIVVSLKGNRRWVLFSRVYGSLNSDAQIRLHVIGYQEAINGVNTQSLIWVYPSGAIELANEPSYWRAFLS